MYHLQTGVERMPHGHSHLSFLACFFFQAEDGIRDKLVTGVQTCALPIWHGPRNTCDGISHTSNVGPPSSRKAPSWRTGNGHGRRDSEVRAASPRLHPENGVDRSCQGGSWRTNAAWGEPGPS